MSEDSSSVSIIDRLSYYATSHLLLRSEGWLIDRSSPLLLSKINLPGMNETGNGWYKYNNQVSQVVLSRVVNKSTWTSSNLVCTSPFSLYPTSNDAIKDHDKYLIDQQVDKMSDAYAQKTYNTLLELLTPTNRHRSSSEISDGLKRIRRIVLTEGIPELVRPSPGHMSWN
jgi:hypothetical protein